MQTSLQSFEKSPRYAVTTGTSTAYVASIPGLTLLTGTQVSIKAHVASGVNATINVNGAGAKNIRKDTASWTAASDFVANAVYALVRDATANVFWCQTKLASQLPAIPTMAYISSTDVSGAPVWTTNYAWPANAKACIYWPYLVNGAGNSKYSCVTLYPGTSMLLSWSGGSTNFSISLSWTTFSVARETFSYVLGGSVQRIW